MTKLEEMIYEAIKASGSRGMTADDLLTKFSYLPYSSVTARPAALKRKGLIYDSGERRLGSAGRGQAVLKAT